MVPVVHVHWTYLSTLSVSTVETHAKSGNSAAESGKNEEKSIKPTFENSTTLSTLSFSNLAIEAVICNEVNVSDHIIIGDLNIFPSWKELHLNLLTILVVLNHKIETQLCQIPFITLQAKCQT